MPESFLSFILVSDVAAAVITTLLCDIILAAKLVLEIIKCMQHLSLCLKMDYQIDDHYKADPFTCIDI